MLLTSRYILYPDDDSQEISHSLKINQLVNVNGIPITLPLKTLKTIVYRVWRISTKEERHEESIFYHLELLNRYEMMDLI